jgi:spermidine synthase
MPELARKFFGMPAEVNCHVDDARHFINITDKTYDVLVIDLFAGEGQPGHVFSLEAFEQMKKVMRPNARLVINYHGFWDGPEGMGTQSVVRTLFEAGFEVYFLPTPGLPVERNILLLATLEPQDLINCRQSQQNPCCQQIVGNGHRRGFNLGFHALKKSYLLTDDRPMLDQLNAVAYKSWREYAIEHYLLRLKKQGMRLY